MTNRNRTRAALCAASLLLAAGAWAVAQQPRSSGRASPAAPAGAGANWPSFRGPNRAGTSLDHGLPQQWSATKNIVWKTPLPGRGSSSPIVWGERIYLTAYSGYGLENNDPNSNVPRLVRHLFCINRADGAIVWKADRPVGPKPSEHPIVQFLDLHGYASSTPAADQSGVYVYYGTNGVVAYGHDGRVRWEQQLGWQTHNWGTASSPILFENLVIVHADIEAGALVALDKQTGRIVWKVETGDRDSWSTPLVVNGAAGPELVYHHSVGSPATIRSVDPRNAAPLWECRALKNYLCPSPIAHDGTVFVIAYQKAAAIRTGGRGNVTPVWEINKGSEICTPIYHQGHVYWTNENDGIAYCVNAENGAVVYQERIEPHPGRIYASGVLGDGKIYYVSRERGTYVLAAGPRYELIAHNVIESDTSVFNATPAIDRGRLLLRSDANLYCIGQR